MNFFGGIDPLICQTKLQRSTRIQCSVHNCPDQRKSRDDESLAHGAISEREYLPHKSRRC